METIHLGQNISHDPSQNFMSRVTDLSGTPPLKKCKIHFRPSCQPVPPAMSVNCPMVPSGSTGARAAMAQCTLYVGSLMRVCLLRTPIGVCPALTKKKEQDSKKDDEQGKNKKQAPAAGTSPGTIDSEQMQPDVAAVGATTPTRMVTRALEDAKKPATRSRDNKKVAPKTSGTATKTTSPAQLGKNQRPLRKNHLLSPRCQSKVKLEQQPQTSHQGDKQSPGQPKELK